MTKKYDRGASAGSKLDETFKGAGRNENPSSPYKYNAHNSPLKDFQRTDGSYGNHNRSSTPSASAPRAVAPASYCVNGPRSR